VTIKVSLLGEEKRSVFGSAFEFASSWGELLLHLGSWDGIAAPRPRQSFVPVLSLEIISAQILSGLEKESDSLAILPGMHLSQPNSDWLVTSGIELPLSSYRNHFNWGSFFK
jgi:hypothetical protein